ncbi:MAG: glutamine-hydrolyzing carbamoyl-phosphate synthase small subunit [Planctomycetes bacterium]|nr:glutamine-hydrolyzing carbamoyl-phosphate synthase small subunit [Planctomycetota bacterium]
MGNTKAALVLEDGSVFEGLPFGAAGEAFGETVFYTGVVGYQEVLTNPSYRGTLVVMTYPIMGCCGTNGEDNESPQAQAAGLIVREYSPYYSSFRATASLEEFLLQNRVVGIREVDTRAVAVHLRERGEMRGQIISGDFDPAATARQLKKRPSPFARDLAGEASWKGSRDPDGPPRCRLTVLNLGVTNGLLDQLARLGCEVQVAAADAKADDILAREPHGVILAGGPGDPRLLASAADMVRSLLGRTPIMGVGLGHQALALALGCRIRRLRTGHRGLNYPVRDLLSGTSLITAQHHSFVVDESAVPDGVEWTHRNLNDGTVEGLRSRTAAAWSVQFHPMPDETERPSPLLARFCEGLPPH